MAKRRFIRELLIVLIVTICIPALSLAQETGKQAIESFKPLITSLKTAKDEKEKTAYIKQIGNRLQELGKEKQLIVTAEEKDMMIDLLDGTDVKSKIIAMQFLGIVKEKRAVPDIIQHLNHKDDSVKTTAAFVLGEIGDERAVDPLLENPDLIVMEFGYSAVAKIGAPALPKLIKLAREKSLLSRIAGSKKKDRRSRKAAYAIGEIRDKSAVPKLMELLKDEDNDLRLAAVRSLAAMDIKEAYPEFERMLNDPDSTVRVATLYRLVKANKDKYLAEVTNILKGNNDVVVLGSAIDLLGELKEITAVSELKKLLNHREGSIRYHAATALWRIEGKVYEYEKDKWIEGEEISFKRRINEEIKRYKVGLNRIERDREKLGEEQYNRLKKQFYNEKQLLKSVDGIRRDAQGRGYLLKYSTEELLEEIKSSGDKYEWK